MRQPRFDFDQAQGSPARRSARKDVDHEQTRYLDPLSIQPMDKCENLERGCQSHVGAIPRARLVSAWRLARDLGPRLVCRMDLANKMGRHISYLHVEIR